MQVDAVQAAPGCRPQPGERNKQSGCSVIQKQILEAVDAIRIGQNPIAAGPWKIAVMTVKFGGPKKLFCGSSPIVVEYKIALQRRTTGECVIAEIQYMIVILPGMVARRIIQRADIRTLSGHGKGFEESILRILYKGDKARSGWIPSFPEKVKTAR